MKEYEFEIKAMGTDISVSFVTTSPEHAHTAFQYVHTTIQRYENTFSRFKTDSELSLVNTQKACQVSSLFCKVLEKAITLSEETNAIFNPLLQISALGYTTDYHQLSHGSNTILTTQTQYNHTMSDMYLDSKKRRVILKDSQQLDFGGFLKGYLAHALVHEINSQYPQFQGIIINMGGDLCTIGLDENNQKFIFGIYNPVTKSDYDVALQNTCLATSGTYKRTWQADTGAYHHIMDKNGQNTGPPIISASIITEDGARAEAFTKVLLTLHPEESIPLLEKNNMQYLAIKNTGDIISNVY